ncbi:MAG: hypothetical protein ABIR18_09055 [Chitinophagaceae bacterium]
METPLNSVESLLQDNALLKIESIVADYMKCSIYKDELELLISFQKNEIEQSDLSIAQIFSFIGNNSEKIVKFSVLFLKNETASVLAIGFSITYTIYMIYLIEKNKKELISYLVKRRIPNARKVADQLLQIKLEMSL